MVSDTVCAGVALVELAVSAYQSDCINRHDKISIGEHRLPLVSAWVSNTPKDIAEIMDSISCRNSGRDAADTCSVHVLGNLGQSLNHGVGIRGSTFGSRGLARPVVVCVRVSGRRSDSSNKPP